MEYFRPSTMSYPALKVRTRGNGAYQQKVVDNDKLPSSSSIAAGVDQIYSSEMKRRPFPSKCRNPTSSASSSLLLLNEEMKGKVTSNLSTGNDQAFTYNLKGRHLIVVSYVCIWTCFYLLVHHARDDSSAKQGTKAVTNPAILVICVEMIKILVSVGLYLKDHTLTDLGTFLCSRNVKSVLVRYIPVAILYAIYNNLMFMNLRSNHPSMYLVISSARLLMTAAVWQIQFGVQIATMRKVALILITLGIFAKDMIGQNPRTDEENKDGDSISSYYAAVLLILFQMSCSVMAGIYNEKLLKHDVCDQYLQNICLYFNSVVVNLLIGTGLMRSKESINFASEMEMLMTPISILIVLTLATAGIMSSMVLRYENSITKGVASASETILTSMIEFFCYGYTFMLPELFGIMLVGVGTVLYSFPRIPKRKPYMLKTKAGRAYSSEKKWVHVTLPFFFLLVATKTCVSNRGFASEYRQNNGAESLLRAKELFLDRKNTLVCTKEASYRPQPGNISILQYNKVSEAENVTAYIAGELSKIGAPVSLMYGTMLHEYRNGTGPCVQANFKDKDFDIAVFAQHFFHVLAMADNIEKKFGWHVKFVDEEKLFLVLLPKYQRRVSRGFQIDVYGFECNRPSKGLIHFPWDGVTLAMNSFLPLTKHKTLAYDDTNSGKKSTPPDGEWTYFYMPLNPSCLLANMYGADFMTPKKGHFIRKVAYNDPDCGRIVLTSAQQEELERQLSFSELSGDSVVGRGDQELLVEDRIKVGPDLAAKGDFGIVSCIRSREDAVFALELAQSISAQHKNGIVGVALELYHDSSLSPFLTAKLESHKGVTVVDIKNPSTSCIVDSLSITRLAHVVLVEPSIVLLSQHGQQKEKRRSLLTPKTICAHTSVKVGSVTSTSLGLDEDLKVFAMLQKECKFQHTFSYQSSIEAGAIVKEDVLLKYNSFNLPLGFTQPINQSNHVGKIHIFERFYHSLLAHTSVVAFMYPVRSNIDWVSNHDHASLVCGTSKATLAACTIGIKFQIEASLHRYRDWKRVLLLDRPVGWVAYDGGIVPQDLGTSSIRGEASFCSSFNSLEGAKKSITAGGGDRNRTMLNIDLVMTVDNVNVAMHNNEGFGPVKFEQNSVQSLSSMTFKEAHNSLRNPCLPSNLIHLWLDENNYHSFDTCRGCSQPVANAKQFLNDIALGWDTDIIFDLKAPHDSGQEIQVQQILSEIKNDRRSEADRQKLLERVKIRYFSTNNTLDILPVHVFEKINSSRFSSELKVYINAPSKLTCLRLAQWAREKDTHLAGCFVIEGDIDVTRSWQELSDKSQITNTLASMKDVKLICDVPRKQLHPDVSLWKNGLVACVEDGYDWIHYPLPVSSKADNSMPSSSVLTSIVLDGTLIKTSFFHALNLTRSKSQIVSAWQEYVSHWGITSPFDWKPHQQHWSFVGEQQQDIIVQAVPDKSTHIFRCVTKILTVMLFLRLEELGLLSIDDAINNLPYKVTWKHVFTNTAGVDGKDAGNKFDYSNSLWSHVSDFVMTVTGVPFVEAVEYYILNPIGLSGSYDVNTLFPPFTARGFTGSHEDLLLIGSTLASGGVSPKTRLRVISTSSTDEMLKDWTRSQNVTASFEMDETVKSMKRFQYDGDGDKSFPFGVVDGYGMGIWLVKGWRTKGHQTSHVRGWLAMGSSEAVMYFDTDDIVVGICAPEQILGLELTAPFAKVVRDLGSRLEDEAYLNPIVSHEVRSNKQLRGRTKTSALY